MKSLIYITLFLLPFSLDALEYSSRFKTPNLEEKQDYLFPTPRGIDALYAWELPGGDGKNVKIIDIERGLNPYHEEFNELFVLSDLPVGPEDHGTSVRGILNAKRDGKGITGIAYGSGYGFLSNLLDFGEKDIHHNVARVIDEATSLLDKGDVLVLEMNHVGPREKLIPVEYWEPIFKSVQRATKKGIHCVAAAGNGAEDLDHEEYEGAFDLDVRDSGCILVGSSFKNKIKAFHSNYGSRVDAFAYGQYVTTTGGEGALYDAGINRRYTQNFGGTSSATPIVAGAVALISSIAKENKIELTPKDLRELLRQTGVSSKESKYTVGKKIGRFPDLKEIIQKVLKLKK